MSRTKWRWIWAGLTALFTVTVVYCHILHVYPIFALADAAGAGFCFAILLVNEWTP